MGSKNFSDLVVKTGHSRGTGISDRVSAGTLGSFVHLKSLTGSKLSAEVLTKNEAFTNLRKETQNKKKTLLYFNFFQFILESSPRPIKNFLASVCPPAATNITALPPEKLK